MTDLDKVDTIIVVMLENRSFDNMLGHLSYAEYANGTSVDGLRAPLQNVAYMNPYQGRPYYPHVMRDGPMWSDLPHESEFVRTQINDIDGQFGMNGFVEAYNNFTTVNQTGTPDPMGFLPPEDVPITSFFANEFAVCDRWFAPLPTSTQPNKLMALTGDSPIVNSEGALVSFKANIGPTFLDWLSERSPAVPWRIYSMGISFFLLMGKLHLLDKSTSRDFSSFADDFANEGDDTFPKVIYIEPDFGDAPVHHGHPCDNHPPTAVGYGEQFLRTIYSAITSRVGHAPERWARTVMIVTYDEHGGFFDHVEPLPIPYEFAPGSVLPPGETEPFVFRSTGPRVPTVIVSPLIEPQTVFNEPMDHTSILQLLAEKWGDAENSYSNTVRQRRDENGIHNIVSVSRVLNRTEPREAAPVAPAAPIMVSTSLTISTPPEGTMQEAFAAGVRDAVELDPDEVRRMAPGALHWAQQDALLPDQ